MNEETQESCLDNIGPQRYSEYAGIRVTNLPPIDMIPSLKSGIAKIIDRVCSFELNTGETREKLYNELYNFLSESVKNGDLQDFFVVCDETNNPPGVIDNNKIRADIQIHPANTSAITDFRCELNKVDVEPDYVTAYKRAMMVVDR